MSYYNPVRTMSEYDSLGKIASIVATGKEEVNKSLQSAQATITSLSQSLDPQKPWSHTEIKEALSSALGDIETAKKDTQITADNVAVHRFNRGYEDGPAATNMDEVKKKIREQRGGFSETLQASILRTGDGAELLRQLAKDMKVEESALLPSVTPWLTARGAPHGVDGRGFVTGLAVTLKTRGKNEYKTYQFTADGKYRGPPGFDWELESLENDGMP